MPKTLIRSITSVLLLALLAELVPAQSWELSHVATSHQAYLEEALVSRAVGATRYVLENDSRLTIAFIADIRDYLSARYVLKGWKGRAFAARIVVGILGAAFESIMTPYAFLLPVWEASHRPADQRFARSSYLTFIGATFLGIATGTLLSHVVPAWDWLLTIFVTVYLFHFIPHSLYTTIQELRVVQPEVREWVLGRLLRRPWAETVQMLHTMPSTPLMVQQAAYEWLRDAFAVMGLAQLYDLSLQLTHFRPYRSSFEDLFTRSLAEWIKPLLQPSIILNGTTERMILPRRIVASLEWVSAEEVRLEADIPSTILGRDVFPVVMLAETVCWVRTEILTDPERPQHFSAIYTDSVLLMQRLVDGVMIEMGDFDWADRSVIGVDSTPANLHKLREIIDHRTQEVLQDYDYHGLAAIKDILDVEVVMGAEMSFPKAHQNLALLILPVVIDIFGGHLDDYLESTFSIRHEFERRLPRFFARRAA